MKLEGNLVKKLDIQNGISKAGKEWRKQEIVLDRGSDFNPLVCISFFGDEKVDGLNGMNVGDYVEVDVNISSKEWNGRYFHSIDGWKFNVVNTADETPVDAAFATSDQSEDLPF